jgi:hypothetical protein
MIVPMRGNDPLLCIPSYLFSEATAAVARRAATCPLCSCGTMVVIEFQMHLQSYVVRGYVVTINSSNSPSRIDRPCAITRAGRFCCAQLHISFPRRFCCPCLLSLHRARRRIGSTLPLFIEVGDLRTEPSLRGSQLAKNHKGSTATQ